MADTPKVKIIFRQKPYNLRITCEGKSFNTSRIKDLNVSEWAFPFHKSDVDWKGLYEELKAFTGEEEFVVQFDGDKPDFETLKFALEKTKAKLISSNNNVVILYSENPYTTRINVNGEIFDTSRIQNRSVEEWIKPIELRGMEWKGIFKELEEFIGTEEYNIQFMGEQEFMKPIIDACPTGVNVTYRIPMMQEKSSNTKEKVNQNTADGEAGSNQTFSSNTKAAGSSAAAAGSTIKAGVSNFGKTVFDTNENLSDAAVDINNINWTGLLLIFIGQIIDLFIGFGFVLSLIGMCLLSPASAAFNKAKTCFIKSVITSVAGAIVLVSLAVPLIASYVLGANSIYELKLRASGAGPLIAFIILTAVINIVAYIFNKDSYKHLLEGCKGIADINGDSDLSKRCVDAFKNYKLSLLLVTISTIAFSVVLLGMASMNPVFWILGMIIWFGMLGTQIYLLVSKIIVIINIWKTYKYRNMTTM